MWPVLPVGVFAWLVMLGAAAVMIACAGAAEIVLRGPVVALLAATAWGVYRLLALWLLLRDCLDEPSELPLVTAFERLPPRVSRLTRLGFFSPRTADELDAVARAGGARREEPGDGAADDGEPAQPVPAHVLGAR